MTIRRTRLGCTVTTTFTETSTPLAGLPAGTPVEHVTLECTQQIDLRLKRDEREKVWDR